MVGFHARVSSFFGWCFSQIVSRLVLNPHLLQRQPAPNTAITIRNIGYQRYLNGRADRRHLAIKTLAGATYYRRIITAAELSPISEQLALDSVLGVSLALADIESVRFMHLTRLETDAVEIEWHHLGVAKCSTMLRSLPQ